MGLKIATDLQTVIKDLIRDSFYPVGSIYINKSNTNPGSKLGGTWARIPNGYLRNNGTATGLATGGGGVTGSTILTTSQLSAHNHPADDSASGGHSHGVYLNWDGGFPAVGYPGWTGPISSGNRIVMNASSGAGYQLGTNDAGVHDHNIYVYNNGGNQGHTHTMEPNFVNIYAWYRTA